MLKTIGVSSVSLAGVPQISKANSSLQYKGIYYDTLTHQVGGITSATIQHQESGLDGEINIAGFNLPVSRFEPVSPEHTRRKIAILNDKKFQKDDLPLKMDLIEHSEPAHHFSGTVTRPSNKYGRLGYYLTANPGYDPLKAMQNMVPDEKWVEGPNSFSIPDTGIPTDSGLDRLAEISKSRGDSTQQGGEN